MSGSDTPSLARRMVLCEYFTTDGALLLAGVRADWSQPKIVTLDVDPDELRTHAQTYFGSGHRVSELTHRLDDLWHAYDSLIEPVGAWSEPDDIVYLVPHGVLHYLPLHSLRLDGQCLIERNPVAYAPSASTLRYCDTNRKTTDRGAAARTVAAVFGDSHDNLPAARAESVRVARQFGVEPVLGSDVTPDMFRRLIVDADVIHFAGHAEFDHAHALESGLQLAGGHILTAREIFGLSGVNANLVTLSGCETGINENHPGDELIGLTRAFLYAGASAVLVSLWDCADRSTAFFMERFYTYVVDPTVYLVDAHRRAMLDTKARYGRGSLYHWAPTVLVGDWR